jgi:hypothetical protein
MSISSDGLCELVGTWPKLETFRCYNYDDDTDHACTTPPTFHGLVKLLRFCLQLLHLSLVIDTTQLDGINVRSPGNEIRSDKLQERALGNSPIDSPLNMALVLTSLFRDLEEVNLDPWNSTPLRSLVNYRNKY